nr:MAG TPA: hypothetical protein [Caudoviricetes sp.]
MTAGCGRSALIRRCGGTFPRGGRLRKKER